MAMAIVTAIPANCIFACCQFNQPHFMEALFKKAREFHKQSRVSKTIKPLGTVSDLRGC